MSNLVRFSTEVFQKLYFANSSIDNQSDVLSFQKLLGCQFGFIRAGHHCTKSPESWLPIKFPDLRTGQQEFRMAIETLIFISGIVTLGRAILFDIFLNVFFPCRAQMYNLISKVIYSTLSLSFGPAAADRLSRVVLACWFALTRSFWDVNQTCLDIVKFCCFVFRFFLVSAAPSVNLFPSASSVFQLREQRRILKEHRTFV